MSDATVVQIRVQVVDMKSFTLDLQVPTYLPARDLTQRVARDAGLEAYWPDGRRRLYWMRARGRLMGDEDKLGDLGVIDGELVYLLPEPPAGSGVLEQSPEYPVTHDYAGAGYLTLLGSLAGVGLWAVGWGVALTQSRSLAVTLLPGFALGFLCASLARHAWGGVASRLRVAVTALFLQLTITVVAFLMPVIVEHANFFEVYQDAIPGFVLGVAGVFFGWLAWWGAAEALPPVVQQQVEAAAQIVTQNCGVCGLPIEQNVLLNCTYQCGQAFHQGCHRAKTSVYRGDRNKCAICGKTVSG